MLATAAKCWQMLTNAGNCWQMLVNTCKCWQVLVRCLKCLLAQQPLTNSVNRSPTCSGHHAKGLCNLPLDCMLMIADNLGHRHSIVSTICCTAMHFALMPPQLGAGAVPPRTYCQTPQCHLVKRPRLRGLPAYIYCTVMPQQIKRPPHRWRLWDVNSHVLAM